MGKHLPQLDGLRAVAILPVLFLHFWTYPAGYEVVNRLAMQGWVGVNLFFVLSGYLITGILWRSKGEPGYYRNFYGRRALRIFPLFFVLMLALLVVMPESKQLEGIRDDWFLYAFFLSNVAVAINGWRLLAADVSWSLAVEEQFYLFWPMVVRALTARRMIILCISLIIVAPFGRAVANLYFGSHPIYVLTPFCMDGFAIGALIAIALHERFVDVDALRSWARLCLLIVLPALVLPVALLDDYKRDSLLEVSFGYSLVDLSAGALLILALHSERVASVLRSPVLVHIGKVSFGMYVFHNLCAIACSKAVEVLGLQVPAGGIGALVTFVGYTVATIAVATGSFYLYEMPFLRLKRFFESRSATDHPPVTKPAVPATVRVD